MQQEHYMNLFTFATKAYKRVSEMMTEQPDLHSRLASILYVTYAGSMLSRIVHTIVLMAGNPFNAFIGPLLRLLVSMEAIVRKLPQSEVQRYHEEWSPGKGYQ